MLELALYGTLLRFVQALALAAPTILVSLFVTGVLRRLVGQQQTKRIFGGSGWQSLLQSWIIGMLLPGCSLGVIPISRELRRAGLTGGAVLAFALSQPLFDPLSLLYGLTLSKPIVVFTFALCSLVLVMVVGSLWDYFYPDSETREPISPAVQAGWPRMASVLLVVFRESAGASMIYMLIGILGSAILAGMLPHGALQRAMNGGNPWAPWTMTWVAVPAYSTPTLAMSQLGSMFQHANSAGASLQLLTLGAGLNLGLVAWIFVQYGWKKASAWFAMLIVAGLGMAYAIDGPMHPYDVDPSDHTHAFDIYCNPYHLGETNLTILTLARLRETLSPFALAPIVALLGITLVGLLLRRIDPHEKIEAWLERREVSRPATKYDIIIPAPIVGMTILVGIFALSVVGCYAYYPAPKEVFAEMQMVRADAISSANVGDVAKTSHYIGVWDAWTRRLEVGVFLRHFQLSRYQHVKAKILREKLELLRHEVEDGHAEGTKQMVREVHRAYDRMRDSFARELENHPTAAPDAQPVAAPRS